MPTERSRVRMHLHKSTWLMGLFSVCGGCGRSAYRLPNFDAATPTATYSIGGGGSIDCDQAVDADGRWLAWTGAAPGDSSANLLLTLTPLGTAPSADNPSVVIRAGLLEAGTLLTLELTSPGLYFSPDSTLIALSYPAQVVQVGSALQVFDLPGTDVCYAGAMAFTDDGKQLAAACTKDSLRVWDTTDLTAAPTETQLPAGTLSNDPTTAALSSLGGGTWLLAVADDAPKVLKISAAGVTPVDITAANLPVKAGSCRLAFNPSQPAQLLWMGTVQDNLQALIVDDVDHPSSHSALALPELSSSVSWAQFSPDGKYVYASLYFAARNDPRYSGESWQQGVVWSTSGGAVTLRSSVSSQAITGNALTRTGKLLAWADSYDRSVASWQLQNAAN